MNLTLTSKWWTQHNDFHDCEESVCKWEEVKMPIEQIWGWLYIAPDWVETINVTSRHSDEHFIIRRGKAGWVWDNGSPVFTATLAGPAGRVDA